MIITKSEFILYRKMYFQLFYDIGCAVAALDLARSEADDLTGAKKEEKLEEQIELAIISLRKALQKTEQMYIEG